MDHLRSNGIANVELIGELVRINGVDMDLKQVREIVYRVKGWQAWNRPPEEEPKKRKGK